PPLTVGRLHCRDGPVRITSPSPITPGSFPMSSPLYLPNRRLFLASTAIAATSPFWTVRGAYAEELTKTPNQTEGPFYPNKLPLDTDNDLLVINDAITPAVGEVTHLTGKVLDAKGNPLKNAA